MAETTVPAASPEELAGLFTEWVKHAGLLPRITEEQCRDLASAFMAGFTAAATRARPGLSDEDRARLVCRMREVAAPLTGDWPLVLAEKDAEIARLRAALGPAQ